MISKSSCLRRSLLRRARSPDFSAAPLCSPMASTSLSIPTFSTALVDRTRGIHSRGRVSQLITAEMSRTTASAPGAVGLVDDEEVGDLHEAGFHGLHGIAAFGDEGHDDGIGEAHDVELSLADAHSLDDGYVRAVDVEELHGVTGGPGKTALASSGGHAADVDAGVFVVALHAHTVGEDGAPGKWAGGVGGKDADLRVGRTVPAPGPEVGGNSIDEGTLARAGRAGDADGVGSANVGADAMDEVSGVGAGAFDDCDGSGEGAFVSGEEVLYELGGGHLDCNLTLALSHPRSYFN